MAGKNYAICLAKKFRERLKNLETTNRIRRKQLTGNMAGNYPSLAGVICSIYTHKVVSGLFLEM